MIAIEIQQKAFEPGDEIPGIVRWDGLQENDQLDIRLIWYTAGKGDQDFEIANQIQVDNHQGSGEQVFLFPAPSHPHSFSGKLISLTWAIEVVLLPGQDAERCEIVIAPGGREIMLLEQVNDPLNS